MGKSSDKGQRYAAEMSAETARQTSYADRPDINLPFGLGRQTWDTYRATDPATGEQVTRWTQNQELDPRLNTVLSNQIDRSGLLSGVESQLGMRAAADMLQPYQWDQFGGVDELRYDPTELRQRAEDAAYQSQVNRLDPRFNTERQALENRLRNQGLRVGDQAYDSAIESFGRTRNDAYEQARLAAIAAGREEAGQLWQQETRRNEIANALRNQRIQEYLGQRSRALEEMQSIGSLAGLQEVAQTVGAGG